MEYGITNKPRTLENNTSNAISEQIHQVLEKLLQTCNITQTYVEENDPWSGIFFCSSICN